MGVRFKNQNFLLSKKCRNSMSEQNSVWNLLKELEAQDNITEVIINSADSIYIEQEGELIRLNRKLNPNDVEYFVHEVAKLNHRPWDAHHPILDGSLPDGSRINAISSLFTQTGPAITIRKYLKHIRRLNDSPTVFGMDEKWIKLIQAFVKARFNIIISGGTGSGKTTLLNLLLQDIDPNQRLVTIEDTRELRFQHPNTVRLETIPQKDVKQLSIRDLVKNSLRMRPDRIIIGESRGDEVYDLLQVMNTGHQGSMTTVHANSPQEAILRMENLFLLSGFDIPLRALRYQISSAIDLVIQIKRTKDKKRVISQITEISGIEGEKILFQDVAISRGDQLTYSGIPLKSARQLYDTGLPLDFFNQL
jgi:pilus assembly protein CpaF